MGDPGVEEGYPWERCRKRFSEQGVSPPTPSFLFDKTHSETPFMLANLTFPDTRFSGTRALKRHKYNQIYQEWFQGLRPKLP